MLNVSSLRGVRLSREERRRTIYTDKDVDREEVASSECINDVTKTNVVRLHIPLPTYNSQRLSSSPKSLANLASPPLGLLKPVFPTAIIHDRLSYLLFRSDHKRTVLPCSLVSLANYLRPDSLGRRVDREVHQLSTRSGCPRLPSSVVV